MLKCRDFLPASLTPAFNDLSSIHSTLSPKDLSTYHFHSSLFYGLIQICTVSIKYLTTNLVTFVFFKKQDYCIDSIPISLFFSYKNMPKYKQCSAGTTIWRYLCETRISLTSSLFRPCLSSSWSQDGSFSFMSAKSKGRRVGKTEWQSAKGKEKTLDRPVPSNTVYIWFIRNEGNGSTWQQSCWKEFYNWTCWYKLK